jgi:hypothetical protein
MSFEQRVWQEMSKLNVNDKTSKKMNLTYLSWSDCWSILADHYPQSYYEFGEPIFYPNDTAEVWCEVTIKQGDSEYKRKMFLPVMDHKNHAITSPDSRQISDARQRCLVKAIAIATGLGLYIYRGEDLPVEKPVKRIDKEKKQAYVAQMLEALNSLDGLAIRQLSDELREDEDLMSEVWKEFNSKQKAAMKSLLHEVRDQ